MQNDSILHLKTLIRDVPDFPKPGIVFKDLTPILQDASSFRTLIESMKDLCFQFRFNKIVAIESRGFIVGAALAIALDKGLVLVRKPGKLPSKTISHSYALEYGEDTLQMHSDSLAGGDRALLVDDVLATGGTLLAAASLARKLGAEVAGALVFVELAMLAGKNKLLKEAALRCESVLSL